jgi:AcrR family transcriptional regulator
MARPRQFTDHQILEVAKACFLEHGASVSTTHIADAVGVSQATLFKRFGTKENLLIAAMRPPEVPEWVQRLAAGPTDAPVADQLCAIAREATLFMRDLVPRMMVLKASGIEPECLLGRYDVPPPLRALRSLEAFFVTLNEQGRIAVRDPAVLAMQFLGALNGRAFMSHMFLGDQRTEAEDLAYAHAMVDHLWRGIAPRSPEEAR